MLLALVLEYIQNPDSSCFLLPSHLHFTCTCAFVCVCVLMCSWWSPEEAIRSSGAGVTGCCELPDVGAEVDL